MKVVYGWYAKGIIFYIGMGTIKRSKQKTNRNNHCLNKRLKAERENSFEVRILHCNLTWQQACEIEISLISLYGRVDLGNGILTNKTSGGEGNPGRKHSKETRNKMSKSHKGKKLSREARDNISKAKTGDKNPNWRKTPSKKTIERKSKANSKPVMTPAGRFESSAEASEFYRISIRTFFRWLDNNNKPEFYRLEQKRNIKNSDRKISQDSKNKINRAKCTSVHTPIKRFESLTESCQAYKVSAPTFRKWLNDPEKPEFYRINKTG